MNEPVTTGRTATELIEDLMAIHPKGYDLSLDRITNLLRKLDNPQDKLPPVIHVAGTNGKGSTIAFARSILEAAGLAVHVHTSPHLVNWHERYRLGCKGKPGQLVDDPTLAATVKRIATVNDGQPITVFEVLTAATFVLFSTHPADVCLIEVGLGGRFDATNVMADTALSIITPVSIDHEAFLGDTFAKIAFEKAGILRRHTPVVVGLQEGEALAVIEQQAARKRCPISVSGEHFHAMRENGRMIFQDESRLLDLALPRLPGDHQIDNAGAAIAATLLFGKRFGVHMSEGMIDAGLQNAQWPGRMQRFPPGILADHAPNGSDVWLDGGHNAGAAAMIATHMANLEERDPRPLYMVCGMLNTKDPSGYFSHFTSLAKQVICVPVESSDSGIEPQALAEAVRGCGIESRVAKGLQDALASIDPATQPRILIAGSLYIVGDALKQNMTPPQ